MSKKLKESFFGNTTIQEVIGELSAPEQLEKVRIYDLDTDKVLFEGRSVDIPKELLGNSLEGVFIFDAEFVVSSGANKKEMWESKLANLSNKSLTEAYSDMASAVMPDGTRLMAVGSTRHTRTYNYEDVTFRFGNKEGRGSYRWQNRPWQRFNFASALIDAMKDAGIEDKFARECIEKTNGLDRALDYFAQNYKKTAPVAEAKKLKEEVSGWIAILDGKKVEIRKGEADSLYGAKKLAIKKFAELFGRPLSKARELQISIAPAYDEQELDKAPASNVQFESKQLKEGEYQKTYDKIAQLEKRQKELKAEQKKLIANKASQEEIDKVSEQLDGIYQEIGECRGYIKELQSIDGMDESKKLGESYSEKELLDAVMDAFGFSKTEAVKYIKSASDKTKQELVNGFKQDAKKNFFDEQVIKEESVDSKKVEATKIISKKDANEIEELLSREDDEDALDGTYKVFTVKFNDKDKHEADIRIEGTGHDYYINAILYNEHGTEVNVLEPAYDFLGKYFFEDSGVEFIAHLIVDESASNKIAKDYGFNENTQLQEAPIYDLSSQYNSRQSFYGKARVDASADGQVETLISYNTPVARIAGGKVELLPAWNTSATTLRHVKEFLKQHDFKAESSAQIAKDYGFKDESVVTEANKSNWKEEVFLTAKNGKIVKYINNKPETNDSVDYYVLFDKEGNYVDKNVDFNVLKKKLESLKSVVTESKEEIVVTCPDMNLQEINAYCEMWQCEAVNTGVKGRYKLVGKDAEVAREELKADGHIKESTDVKEQIQEIEEEFTIKYWATEEDREEGFSDIFMDSFTDKKEAIVVAKKMVDRDGIASVEVIDENDVTVFGYDGAETWNESKQVKQEPKKVTEKKVSKVSQPKKLDEDLKIISDISQYSPWAGAVDTWNKIEEENMIDELESMLEDLYPEGLTVTQLNDILWFDSEMILEQLGIAEPEDDEEEDEDEDIND